MSKFYNTSRGSVSATIDGAVAVFAPKHWTELAGNFELSSSLKSLLDQGILVPGAPRVVVTPARASKLRNPVLPKRELKSKTEVAPAKVEAPAVKAKEDSPKAKEALPLLSPDKT